MPPRKHQPHPKWKTRVPASSLKDYSIPRIQLTPDNVKWLAARMQEAYKWDTAPKDFQIEAVQAQLEGRDIVVQAPTGAGKTALAAGPYLWPGYERRFTIMVCPLLALEEEMVCYYARESISKLYFLMIPLSVGADIQSRFRFGCHSLKQQKWCMFASSHRRELSPQNESCSAFFPPARRTYCNRSIKSSLYPLKCFNRASSPTVSCATPRSCAT